MADLCKKGERYRCITLDFPESPYKLGDIITQQKDSMFIRPHASLHIFSQINWLLVENRIDLNEVYNNATM